MKAKASKLKKRRVNLFEKIFKTRLPLSLVIITFSLIAINIVTQPQPVNGFHPLEMKLQDYPTQAEAGEVSFSLIINDSRQGEKYLSKIIVDGSLIKEQELKNGTNHLSVNLTKGTHKVKIEVWNPSNEYNGYGYMSNPFSLFFTVDVK